VTYVSEDFRIDIEDQGKMVGQFNLHNVYKEYCARRAEERETMLSKIVQVALARHKKIPEDWADAKPDIMPAVRSRATFEMLWLEHRAPGGQTRPDLPSYEVGDHLLAMLVYDLPAATQTLTANNWSSGASVSTKRWKSPKRIWRRSRCPLPRQAMASTPC
jgi:hypothetical protein